jgi:hypothetical protein
MMGLAQKDLFSGKSHLRIIAAIGLRRYASAGSIPPFRESDHSQWGGVGEPCGATLSD